MILVYDTETTTFPSPSLPANHPDQARIVQLAWLLLDEKFVERACFNSLIRLPPSVKISDGARNAHGITEEDCAKYGCPIDYALDLFFCAKRKAQYNVAHNIKFDKQLIQIEDAILYGPATTKLSNGVGAVEFCTMEAMTPICRLPHTSGRRFGSAYKWPKLQEAYQHCFGESFEGAHDALADVRATARIYKWLMEQKTYKAPVYTAPEIAIGNLETKVA